MRRYGGLRNVLPITFVTFGLGYLAIIGVPPFAGFFSKDAIIETAFAAGGVKGILLGGATLLGAGITAFYMTRRDADDVLRREALGAGTAKPCAPARVAGGDDVADDRARRRLGGRRAALWRSAARWSTGWNRSSERTRSTTSIPVWVMTTVDAGGRRRRHRDRLPHVRHAAGPGRGARPVRALTVAARKRPLRRRVQRGRCSCGPAQRLTAGSGRDRRRGHRRRVDGLGRRGRRAASSRIAAVADRVRPLLRAVDVRRRGPRRRGDPGGEAVVTVIPWLTVLWAVPMVGAARGDAAARRAARELAK